MDEFPAKHNETVRYSFVLADFFGHCLPGIVSIGLSFYWIMITVRQYCNAQKKEMKFISVLYTFNPRWKLFTYYNFTLLNLTNMTIIAIYKSFEKGQFTHIDHMQHAAMFILYIFHLVVYNIQTKSKFLTLLQADYVSLCICFFVNCVLVLNHLGGDNGNSPLRYQIHMLLAVILAVLTCTVLLETAYRNCFFIAIMRSYLLLIQGTWVCHISFVQYRIFDWLPEWDEKNDFSRMITSTIYVAHWIVDFFVVYIYAQILFIYFNRQKVVLRDKKILPSDVNLQLCERLL